ncbi:ferredoxin:thioredoxin reductase [candidate division WOR-3 bacterium]|nr:ferredoxin:thioredoxin reductase [candidate division WOR-3 bacterium]
MANKWDAIVGTPEYNENLARIRKIAGQQGHLLNPDEERIRKVVGLMTMNNNEFGKYYCPCKQNHPLDPAKDVLCPCPGMEEEIAKDGHCFCKLFYQKK